MFRAKSLHHRPVVDLDAAEKLGHVEEVILDPAGGRLAGFVVGEGRPLGHGGAQHLVPASAIHAIGPDALTLRQAGDAAEPVDAETLPRLSHLVGKKMVSHHGELLGSIDDVVVDEATGRIVAYAFQRHADTLGGLGQLLSSNRRPLEFLQTATGLRVGEALIVVPDDAVVVDDPEAAEVRPGLEADRLGDDAATWRPATTIQGEPMARTVGGPAGPDEATQRLDWEFEPAERRPRPADAREV